MATRKKPSAAPRSKPAAKRGPRAAKQPDAGKVARYGTWKSPLTSDVIVAGVIYNPANEELFLSERGKGAFLNDQRLRVAARRRLSDAVVACGMPHMGRGDRILFRSELAAVQEQVAGVRRFGAAALDLAWVAAGRFDAFWERDLSPWDMAAGILMVREAGGFATDLDDGDAIFGKRQVIAGNEFLHKALSQMLKDAKK